MNALISLPLYDEACRAIAAAHSVDEVKNIRGTAEAMRAYARQAKERGIEIKAAEIRIRAERRIGELMVSQKETVGMSAGGRPTEKTGFQSNPVSSLATLAEAGIDKNLAHRARTLAAVPEAEFEGRLDTWRERVREENERVTTDLLASGEKHVRGTLGTGDNEWFTPPDYIEAARSVMGGIDLDPATHPVAQRTVKAARFFTLEDDGLAQSWDADRLWLNPPYAQPFIAQFIAKLVENIEDASVTEAIALTHNYTDTSWFHHAASVAYAVCFTRGRISFLDPEGQKAAPTQGQAFFYFGANGGRFAEIFSRFGVVMVPRA